MSGALQAAFSMLRSFSSPPVNTAAPTIGGTAATGQSLSVYSNGAWTGSPTPTYTYQWQLNGSDLTAKVSASLPVIADYIGGTLRCVVTATNSAGTASATSASSSTVVLSPGQQAYTTAGTYSWTCPSGVTSVSVVCVGAGYQSYGGALEYLNNISVTPGNTYTITVPTANTTPASSFSGGGGVSAQRGIYRTGNFGGDGGGMLGYGGGAGGYSGTGGEGIWGYLDPNSTITGNSGAGGGGGAGGQWLYGSATPGSGAGGGVGLQGEGSSGSGGTVSGSFASVIGNGGGGGSGGSTGGASYQSSSTKGTGGTYGGGGGSINLVNGAGGGGAVRIIWPGTTRQFPSTNTTDM